MSNYICCIICIFVTIEAQMLTVMQKSKNKQVLNLLPSWICFIIFIMGVVLDTNFNLYSYNFYRSTH